MQYCIFGIILYRSFPWLWRREDWLLLVHFWHWPKVSTHVAVGMLHLCKYVRLPHVQAARSKPRETSSSKKKVLEFSKTNFTLLITRKFLQSIRQTTNALNKIQLMRSMKLLHVSVGGAILRGSSRTKVNKSNTQIEVLHCPHVALPKLGRWVCIPLLWNTLWDRNPDPETCRSLILVIKYISSQVSNSYTAWVTQNVMFIGPCIIVIVEE